MKKNSMLALFASALEFASLASASNAIIVDEKKAPEADKRAVVYSRPATFDPAYDVLNGLPGMKRDIVLRLLAFMRYDNARIRTVFGMCRAIYEWKVHCYFVEPRLGLFPRDCVARKVNDEVEKLTLQERGFLSPGAAFILKKCHSDIYDLRDTYVDNNGRAFLTIPADECLDFCSSPDFEKCDAEVKALYLHEAFLNVVPLTKGRFDISALTRDRINDYKLAGTGASEERKRVMVEYLQKVPYVVFLAVLLDHENPADIPMDFFVECIPDDKLRKIPLWYFKKCDQKAIEAFLPRKGELAREQHDIFDPRAKIIEDTAIVRLGQSSLNTYRRLRVKKING